MKAIFLLTGLAGLGLGTATAEHETFTINTLNGAKFEKCRVLKVDPDGLCFAHERGTAKVPFSHLGPEWHKRFNFDADKAKDFVRTHTRRPARLHNDDGHSDSAPRRSVHVLDPGPFGNHSGFFSGPQVDFGHGGGDIDFSDGSADRPRRFGSRGGLVDGDRDRDHGGDSDFSDGRSGHSRRFGSRGGLVDGDRDRGPGGDRDFSDGRSGHSRRFGSRGGLVHGSHSHRGHDKDDDFVGFRVPVWRPSGFHGGYHGDRDLYYSGLNRHFPVGPFLTFGGYSYPNGFSPYLTGAGFYGTGFYGGGFGYGVGHGGFGTGFHSGFFRNPCVLPSGGFRVGGTGGLIQARSGSISHR
jgi:hypothetical protein